MSEVTENKPKSNNETKPSTEIVLKINESSPIEIINLSSSVRSTLIPKENKIKFNSSNLYYVPITNSKLDIDTMNAIKVKFKFCEMLQILGVQNGIVIILPITNFIVLKDQDNIGSLI